MLVIQRTSVRIGIYKTDVGNPKNKCENWDL